MISKNKVGGSPPPEQESPPQVVLGRNHPEITIKKEHLLPVADIRFDDVLPPAGTPPSTLEIVPMTATIPTEEHGIEVGVVVPETASSHGLIVSPVGPSAITRAPATFEGPRRSHKCCGVCCDCRQAVIIVDLISIELATVAIISLVIDVERNPDDDYTDENGDSSTFGWYKRDGILVAALLACYLAGLLLLVIAMNGAVNFRGCYVWFGLIYHLLDAVIYVVTLNPVAIIDISVSLLFAYPHAVLIYEIKRGIMSEERYPNESYSCWCV